MQKYNHFDCQYELCHNKIKVEKWKEKSEYSG